MEATPGTYDTCQTATRQGAGACPIRSVSAPALEQLLLQRIEFLATHEPVIERMVLRTGAEATTKVPFLREERARIDAELRRRKEEARRLMAMPIT